MKTSRENFPGRRFGRRPRLFISYRRRTDSASARLLKDELTRAFGEGAVFRDVDDIEAGEAFPETIREAVEDCDALLLLVSPGWVESVPRLRNPDDFVRREVAAALARRVPLIPVLLGDARMPEPEALPEEIRGLASIQAIELSDQRWDYDVARLVKLIRARTGARRPVPFFGGLAGDLRSFLGTPPGALLVVSAILFAGVFGLGYAVWHSFLSQDFEACVRAQTPKWIGAEARVTPDAPDSVFVTAGEYAAALQHPDAPGGIPLVLSLSNAEGEVGAIFFKYFRADDAADSLFRVEKVFAPPCEEVQDYFNSGRPANDKHVLKNWDKLAVRLGGNVYLVRPGDRGDHVTVTTAPAPAELELPWKK